jgi:DNA-binding NarL/FixJ family response regulator
VDVLRTAPARQRREEALLALVPAALDAGDPATAAAALDEADRLALDAGSGFAELVAQLRSRMADGDGPPGRPLSAAQRRVADLAASGFTNAAIARVLSITKRAVELHLTNAYRNLGIRGRRDLPAALRHRGGTR